MMASEIHHKFSVLNMYKRNLLEFFEIYHSGTRGSYCLLQISPKTSDELLERGKQEQEEEEKTNTSTSQPIERAHAKSL
jgi:hypothetical protein